MPYILFDLKEDLYMDFQTTNIHSTLSISNGKGNHGTLSCCAYLKNSGTRVALSNWHVLCSNGAQKKDKIWLVDENKNGSKKLIDVGNILDGKVGNIWFHNWKVYVDCAISSFRLGESQLNELHVPGYEEAQVGIRVYKKGSGTGYTQGRVLDNRHAEKVSIDGRNDTALGQILIQSIDDSPFSAAGDSGALIFNENNFAVGLLWGTNAKGQGIASPIHPVLYALNIGLEKPQIDNGN